MNTLIDSLLKEVKEFDEFFKEFEDMVDPEIKKTRIKGMLSLILLAILVLGCAFVPSTNIKIILFIFLISDFFWLVISIRKFDKIYKDVPSKFNEFCIEMKNNLENKYKKNTEKVVGLLLDDLNNRRVNRLKKYETWETFFGGLGLIFVTAIITLIFENLFSSSGDTIPSNVFISSIILVVILSLLIKIMSGALKNQIEEPIFGNVSREVYLFNTLNEVKYLILKEGK